MRQQTSPSAALRQPLTSVAGSQARAVVTIGNWRRRSRCQLDGRIAGDAARWTRQCRRHAERHQFSGGAERQYKVKAKDNGKPNCTVPE